MRPKVFPPSKSVLYVLLSLSVIVTYYAVADDTPTGSWIITKSDRYKAQELTQWWKTNKESLSGIQLVFHEDGMFNALESLTHISYDGTWKTNDGVLEITITNKHNAPQTIRAHYSQRWGNLELIYEDGVMEQYKRGTF